MASKYSEEERHGRTMSQIRTPWVNYDPNSETWGPGSFHPMSPNGLLGKNEFKIEEIESRLRAAMAHIADETLTIRFRTEAQRRVEKCESWLRQLRGEPGAIPAAAGEEYMAWVEGLRRAADDI